MPLSDRGTALLYFYRVDKCAELEEGWEIGLRWIVMGYQDYKSFETGLSCGPAGITVSESR